MQEKLSYGQISRLGKFLQSMSKNKKLKFLKTTNFDQEEIAKSTIQCFRPYFLESLEEKLKSSFYSLSIDNASICGENFCAIKVKFLELEKDESLATEITTIKNKVLLFKN